jgi:hypothetical protein
MSEFFHPDQCLNTGLAPLLFIKPIKYNMETQNWLTPARPMRPTSLCRPNPIELTQMYGRTKSSNYRELSDKSIKLNG